jgi:glutathione S-transferase
MQITTMQITTFRWVPPFIQGYVRDLRLRWACEEAGLSYTLNLVSFDDVHTEAYKKRQPFEQVPCFEDGGIQMFESGAIVLHIGERSTQLLPADPPARARATTWVFAAMNSIEPFVSNFNQARDSDDLAAKAVLPAATEKMRSRLSQLDQWLGDRNFLEETFTAGDLMMTCVLRNLMGTDLLEKEFPRINAYRKRCEDRPAFKKALADHMQTFKDNEPKT